MSVLPGAHALTAFREVSGEGRRYTATTFPRDPYAGCEQTIRQFRAVGWIGDPHAAAYAVLDVLNAEGDIIQDFAIPDAHAFQHIKKKLGLAVESDG